MTPIFQLIKNRRKLLGRNERSLIYIHSYNSRKSIRIADDKILTKKILIKNNVPVSKLVAIIKDERQLESFDWSKLPESFVIKPVTGYEGAGIEIFYNKDKNGDYIKADGSKYTIEQLKILSKAILNGEFSLHNSPDRIIIEERVKLHRYFKSITYKGAPDIRIIVFNKIPIMSYIRIPTKESDGKANLAKGAIGAGIDMAKGLTTYGIYGKGKSIETIQGTNLKVSGIKIPYWDRLLRYSIEVSQCTGLGFCGVDFLIDKDAGPLVVEINARPGLSIQLANRDGLRWRLKKVRDIKFKTIEKSIRLAKDLFGGEIEEEIRDITGKNILGLTNDVKVSVGDNTAETHLKIDTGNEFSYIDTKFVLDEMNISKEILTSLDTLNTLPTEEEKLKHIETETTKLKQKFDYFDRFEKIEDSYSVFIKVYIEVNSSNEEYFVGLSDRTSSFYKILLGKKSLSNILIDPSKS